MEVSYVLRKAYAPERFRNMTETEYVVSGFADRFRKYVGKKIVLHGSRDYAKAIIESFDSVFHFAGLMSRDPLDGQVFCGLPVLNEEDIPRLRIDMIILTERVKYAEAVYQSVREICEESGIRLFNMYGLDEIGAHREIENCRPMGLSGWKQLCSPYGIVVFETMDTFLYRRDSSMPPKQRYSLRTLALWLISRGTDVRFSLRKSEPEEIQLEGLKNPAVYPDIENHIIRRCGEDLSFRKLREENPKARILYIGQGLVNECLLPRCYGIDTYRFSTLEYRPDMPVVRETKEIPFDEELPEKIRQKIHESDIVSFDVFDTLLIRKTLNPQDVFVLAARRAKEKGYRADGFEEARKEAARKAGNADIEEIYSFIGRELQWDEKTARKMMDLELETERSVLAPRTETVRLMEYALRDGKRVVLTSDMYLPESLMGNLLSENGIRGYEKLFVSCDYGKSKAEGLYEEIFRLRKDHETILHIGDNEAADGDSALRSGIESIIIPSVLSLAVSRGWEGSVRAASTFAERCLLGSVIAQLFRDPFQNPNLKERPIEERLSRFGAGAAGPLAAGFITWLLAGLSEKKFDGVLFLSRDGYLPMKIYRALPFSDELPPAVYFYANRRSSFQCCADKEDSVRTVLDTGNYYGMSYPEILASLFGIGEEDILPAEDGENGADYIRRHWDVIVRTAESAREGYRRYAEKEGMKENGEYAVVDFIANGTTQIYLEQFMPYSFTGYYFGNHTPDVRLQYNIIDYLESENETLLNNYIELENAFISPEPTVNRVTASGDIEFADEIRSREELDHLEIIHQNAVRTALEFFSLFYEKGDVVDPHLPEEMYAAEGFHWIQRNAFDDWARLNIKTKDWRGTDENL